MERQISYETEIKKRNGRYFRRLRKKSYLTSQEIKLNLKICYSIKYAIIWDFADPFFPE